MRLRSRRVVSASENFSSGSLAVMAVSSENRTRLLLATREAAAALVEDMTYIRETLAKADKITSGELRRLSAVLRRLLVDNDLRSIAPPRIGQVSFLVPDNNPIYYAARNQSVGMFLSGGIRVFNNEFRAIATSRRGALTIDPAFDKTKTITVSLDGFLKQKVLAHNDEWATRGQVIKYVANSASGVHSKSTKALHPEASEILLSRIRKSLRFSKYSDTGIKITVDWVAFGGMSHSEFVWTPESIDSVLVELLCAAHFLAASPDIHSLEFAIHKEFGVSPRSDRDNIR